MFESQLKSPSNLLHQWIQHFPSLIGIHKAAISRTHDCYYRWWLCRSRIWKYPNLRTHWSSWWSLPWWLGPLLQQARLKSCTSFWYRRNHSPAYPRSCTFSSSKELYSQPPHYEPSHSYQSSSTSLLSTSPHDWQVPSTWQSCHIWGWSILYPDCCTFSSRLHFWWE